MTATSDISVPSTDISGKVALVTGTTRGLGRHFARVLAKAGAKVAITGRSVDKLESLKAEIEADGGTALPIALDVMNTDEIPKCVDACEAAFGPVDILVNNAAVNLSGIASEVTPETFDILYTTNARGSFFMAQTVGNRMIARGQGGYIVNIASIGALHPLGGLSAYCMTKAAVAMMTKCLAKEWARHRIGVNAICPGYMATDMTGDWFEQESGQKQLKTFPRRRIGQQDDLDGLLMLLVSDQARFLTGSIISADDGQML